MAIFGGGLNVSDFSDQVDIYNAISNTWSNTTLSQARAYLAATSVGDLALFGGGYNESSPAADQVDIYNSTSNTGVLQHYPKLGIF